MGHYKDRARTGIARVIENLAIALSRNPDLELSFCAYESLETWFKTKDYLNQQDILDPGSLSGPANKMGQKIAEFYERAGLASPVMHSSQNFFMKLHRRGQRVVGLNTDFVSNRIGLASIEKQDILHSPFLSFPASSNGAGQLKRFLTIYDLIPILFPQYFKYKEAGRLERLVRQITPADYVFAISESTKNDLCNYAKIDPSRVLVTPLAASGSFEKCVDADLIAATRSKYAIPDAPYVLSLCTLEPRKNIDQTIRCFYRLVEEEKIDDLNLVLVGTKGWKFGRIFEEMGRKSIAENRIFTTGYVPDEDLSPLYSGAQMFVYPSFYEGFGLPPLEAMQCGVPVITSDTSSLPEVVGDAGIMLAPDDGDAICQAMLDLHSDEDLRLDLSRKGMQRAAQFSWDKCADETVKGYFRSQ